MLLPDTAHTPTNNSQTIDHSRVRIGTHYRIGIRLDEPDWRTFSRSLAVTADVPGTRMRLYFALNAYWEPLDFELPAQSEAPWQLWIDTARESPDDIVAWEASPLVADATYRVGPRSVVVMFAGVA